MTRADLGAVTRPQPRSGDESSNAWAVGLGVMAALVLVLVMVYLGYRLTRYCHRQTMGTAPASSFTLNLVRRDRRGSRTSVATEEVDI